MKCLLLFVLAITVTGSLHAERHRDIQELTVKLAPTASYAAIPITVWFDSSIPGQQGKRLNDNVVGTGFIVDDSGDFVTAAHVLDLSSLMSSPSVSNAHLTAEIQQKSGDSSDTRFTVVELDKNHDLALCHINGFRAYTPAESPLAKATLLAKQSGMPANIDTSQPFASLGVSQAQPQVGQFVLVSGFPVRITDSNHPTGSNFGGRGNVSLSLVRTGRQAATGNIR